jgi:hypothetical protein
MGPAIISNGDHLSDTLTTPGGGVRVLAVKPSQTVAAISFHGGLTEETIAPLNILGGAETLTVDAPAHEWTFFTPEQSRAVSALPWMVVSLAANAEANTQVAFLLSTDNPGA